MSNTQSTAINLQAQLNKFDHVVVLMLENRSFDNLLGNLYSPGELKPGQQFDGLQFNKPHFNVVPNDVKDGHAGEKISPSRASSYFQPYPDPGEFYAHVNTQLTNQFNPAKNSGMSDGDIVSPYNVPDGGVPDPPPMTGFITDYISVLRSLMKKSCLNKIFNFLGLNPKWFKLNDKYEDYKAIMECYENDQVPVMKGLAKGFAVFDHWHCDVPSQTYTNRAFWHSGTSFGFVNNSPMKNWIENKNSPTLFNLLEANGKDWKIYTDNFVSLTGVIHFQQLVDFHFTGNFKSYKHFLADAASGSLPAYSFVEPRFFTPHNDQHPSGYDTLIPVDAPGKVGSVLLGEKLIWEVYNAVKNSNGDVNGNGNTWKNTLLIITHDEHGGCYDHVAPGPAPSPDKSKPVGQDGFAFDRLGIRVPMIMVSAHINANTIINTQHRHTSFLHTMCKKWALPHLTDRDALANDFTEVFNAEEIRDVSTWPDLPEPVIPEEHYQYNFSDALIGDLEKNILRSVSHWKTGSTARAEKIKTVKEAMQWLYGMENELPGANLNELTHTWSL